MMQWVIVSIWMSVSPARAGMVVINEFVSDPSGADAGNEWIELKNVTDQELYIGGLIIRRAKSTWSDRLTVPSGTYIPSGGYFVIGEASVSFADLSVDSGTLDLGNASSSGDALQIGWGLGYIEDTVVYGPNNSDGFEDDRGLNTGFAPKPSSGQSLSRAPDGADTDVSADDFISQSPTPGQPNAVVSACDPSGGGVVINEFLPDPAGADGDALAEWIELRADRAQSLGGWTLERASKADNHSVVYAFSEGATIGAGAYLLVSEPNGPATALRVDQLGLYSGSGGDSLRLLDCEGTVVDTVVYGSDNTDQIADDSGVVATSLAPKPGPDQSVARKVNGEDTDRSGDDFQVGLQPTPGAPNPTPPECLQGAGEVVINEFLADPPGADADAALEFVELYNSGSVPVEMAGWSLVGAGKPDDQVADFVFPEGARIEPGAFWVVGDVNVDSLDFTVALGLGNGSGGDSIHLVSCDETIVDSVVYGTDNSDGMTDENGQIAQPMPKPGSGSSGARVEDGVDSDQPADWFVDSTPTPGETNWVELSGGPGGDRSSGGGCGRGSEPSAPDAPSQGCTTVNGGYGWFGVLFVGLIARRRRTRRHN